MLINILFLAFLVALVVVFAFVAVRAWRSQNGVVKWGGTILAGLLTVVFALVTLIVGKGTFDLVRPYPVEPVSVTIEGTPEQIARGEYLAAFLCASCHTENGELPLTGGKNLSDDSGIPLGDVYPPNITPAGRIKDLSDADIFRILRTGVEPGGRLTAMGFFPVRYLSDDDAKAVIAYLRHSQPVEGTKPPLSPSPVLAALVALGMIKAEGAELPIQPVTAPPKAASVEYGEYVARFGDCRGCHGPDLTGNAPPPAPPGASNLTVIVPNWSKDDFFKTMRTGIDPTGRQVSPIMPWKTIGKLDDVELEALYLYLHGLTPTNVK